MTESDDALRVAREEIKRQLGHPINASHKPSETMDLFA